eukprot:gene23932-31062_t
MADQYVQTLILYEILIVGNTVIGGDDGRIVVGLKEGDLEVGTAVGEELMAATTLTTILIVPEVTTTTSIAKETRLSNPNCANKSISAEDIFEIVASPTWTLQMRIRNGGHRIDDLAVFATCWPPIAYNGRLSGTHITPFASVMIVEVA